MGAPSRSINGVDFSKLSAADQQYYQGKDMAAGQAAAKSGNGRAYIDAANNVGGDVAATGIKGDPTKDAQANTAAAGPDLTDQLLRGAQYAKDSRFITTSRRASFLTGAAPMGSSTPSGGGLMAPTGGKTLLGG